ncbi:hypothetical protein FQN54_005233 [Arachnomyces sp. PD_36]|nr:hypothetical protein FQN54_005233 [Arachnomyces sp. PD_36]
MSFNGPGQEPSWHWPEGISGAFPEDPSEPAQDSTEPSGSSPPPKRKHYPPRTCRICFETVLPTYQPPSENLPDFLKSEPQVVYESADPELGRLLRPCQCRGSSRYVHEGCLQQWRHADPAYSKRNYWHCPTCGFKYRLERVRWGRWISSKSTQIFLTASILLLTMFLLGFIADPIINLYIDPYDTISSAQFWEPVIEEDYLAEEGNTSWVQHFIKGLASLGVLSFIKVLFALSPWQWWNLRSSGLVGGGRRTTGRDRVSSISWVVVVIGVTTFLWAVYKGVRAWSRRTLEKASERIIDVPLTGDDDEDEDEGEQATSSSHTNEDSKKDN